MYLRRCCYHIRYFQVVPCTNELGSFREYWTFWDKIIFKVWIQFYKYKVSFCKIVTIINIKYFPTVVKLTKTIIKIETFAYVFLIKRFKISSKNIKYKNKDKVTARVRNYSFALFYFDISKKKLNCAVYVLHFLRFN